MAQDVGYLPAAVEVVGGRLMLLGLGDEHQGQKDNQGQQEAHDQPSRCHQGHAGFIHKVRPRALHRVFPFAWD